ncbi:hypothetical protein Zmor_015340 [Zophobas morio]|uniref:Uncharacterized protein n=1 Tax=Zophobas morio TaxID=2755281 RepID=A0AA38HVN2_9CUCU|nr:hypothetical protein Zmor_026589 [Zophobas morio]KAJ3656251.1 hypothetical protein Zmor_015340 [Zophobas morio]
MKDFGYNVKKKNGQDYKGKVIKTIWNTVEKSLQEKYKENYNIVFNPFQDVDFASARKARDAKRKALQQQPEKRRASSSLTSKELNKMPDLWKENTPVGLQRKLFHIASYKLAWRGGKAVNCLIDYFEEELDNAGRTTGRIVFNSPFSKTAEGGAKPFAEKQMVSAKLG